MVSDGCRGVQTRRETNPSGGHDYKTKDHHNLDSPFSWVSKGAKPTSNALQFARTRGHKDIEKILVDAGAKE